MTSQASRIARQHRTRARLRRLDTSRPRLTVFRSSKHIYAQLIDDTHGHTLCAASTKDKELRGELKTGATQAAAQAVGKLIGERAKDLGIDAIRFDRGGYLYHGRIKALADGAREAGLDF